MYRYLLGYLDALLRGQLNGAGSVDVVVTANEINDRHGTGVLLKRILKGRPCIFCIRSRNHWGRHDFGDWNVTLSHQGYERPECFRHVQRFLAGRQVNSVLCVPFLIDELLTSIAIHDTFDARLCAYVMDDQNVATSVIPDPLMREFLEKSSLRLATHPELRSAYEQKYGLPFFLLPAVAPEHLISREPFEPLHDRTACRAALMGSFWDQSWFDALCSALRNSGWRIDWYGNNRSPFLEFPDNHLAQAGITPLGVVSEDRLAVELRKYPFVIVPAAPLDGHETNPGVASLSLPGRILFAAATSNTPILVVGSENTCAARFVRHFGIGETVPYNSTKLSAAMTHLSDPSIQSALRRKAATIAPSFSDQGIVDWLQTSIHQGHAADTRFEDTFTPD
jgi:hypothetical protein